MVYDRFKSNSGEVIADLTRQFGIIFGERARLGDFQITAIHQAGRVKRQVFIAIALRAANFE